MSDAVVSPPGASAPPAAVAPPSGAPAGSNPPAPPSPGVTASPPPAVASSRGQALIDAAASAAGREGQPAAGANPETPPAPADWGRDVPEHLRGATAEETVERLAKAYAGARTAMAQRGEVPDDPAAYTTDWAPEGVVKDYLAELSGDTFFQSLAGDAKQHGLTTTQYRGFIEAVLTKAIESDLIEAPVSAEAVLEALMPTSPGLTRDQALKAAARDIREDQAFLTTLKARATAGEVPQAAVDALDQLFGTVGGAQLIRMLRGQGTERAPVAGGGGRYTEADVNARIADPRYRTDPDFAKETALIADIVWPRGQATA